MSFNEGVTKTKLYLRRYVMKVYTKRSMFRSFVVGVLVGALLVTGVLIGTGHLTLNTSTHTEQVEYTYTTADGLSFQ